jgi:hypothetical protein
VLCSRRTNQLLGTLGRLTVRVVPGHQGPKLTNERVACAEEPATKQRRDAPEAAPPGLHTPWKTPSTTTITR